MNVYEVKKMLQHKPITDIPLRVVSYCRVSTKSLEQATSIENQVEHYRKKIQGIPAWTFVGEYVDNGISGTSVKARVQFNKMIEDAENGKFDLIVTKAVSRFARNTLDSLMYSRKLLEVGVASGLIRMASSIWTRTVSFVCRSSRHWRRMNPQKNRKPFALVSRKQSNAVRYLGLTTCSVFEKETESWRLTKAKPRLFESCLSCMPRINTA